MNADGTCSSIACSCQYHPWVMCCGLNRLRWVAFVPTMWLLLQFKTESFPPCGYCSTSRRNHSHHVVIALLQDGIISKDLWPPSLSGVRSPNFFLWGCLKEIVYRNKPRTIEALKDNIWQEINTEHDVLLRTADNVRHIPTCLQGGSHFQHLCTVIQFSMNA